MAASRDVVIVGGGHNGLVAAAYLARAGLSVLVCERRDIVGGAAVSEHPFGPDYTVTSLSYVVSLLPRELVSDLQLVRHGYHVYPQGPYFAPRRDGRYLALPHDRGGAPRRDQQVLGPRRGQLRRLRGAYGRDRRDPRPAADRDPAPARLAPASRPAASGPAAAAPAQGRHQSGRRHHQAAHWQHRRCAGRLLRQRRAARPPVGLRRDRHLGWSRARRAALTSRCTTIWATQAVRLGRGASRAAAWAA